MAKEDWQQRAANFLLFSIYMPKWLYDYWMKNDRYMRFPKLPVFYAYLLPNVFGAKINMYARRFTRRYLKYGAYRLLEPMRGLVHGLFFNGKSPLLSRKCPGKAP